MILLLLHIPVLRSSEQGVSAVRPHEGLANCASSFPSESSGACLPRQNARERASKRCPCCSNKVQAAGRARAQHRNTETKRPAATVPKCDIYHKSDSDFAGAPQGGGCPGWLGFGLQAAAPIMSCAGPSAVRATARSAVPRALAMGVSNLGFMLASWTCLCSGFTVMNTATRRENTE